VKLYDEIVRIAYELYEKGGRLEGRELDNWLEAERIVMAQHAEQKKSQAKSSSVIKKKKTPTKKVSKPVTKTKKSRP